MTNNIEHYVCLLPNNNQEFEDVEARLKELNVNYERRDCYKRSPDCFSRAYRISEDESKKLPRDEKGPFLPVGHEEQGHGLTLDSTGKVWQLCLKNEVLVD